MPSPWGNPNTESFRRKFIREARAAGGLAFVHSEIVDVVARLLEELSDLLVEIPHEVPSYDVAGTEHQRIGLAVHLALPLPPPREIIAVAGRWKFDGFVVEVSELVELRFMGTVAEARDLTEQAIAERIDRVAPEDVSGPGGPIWPGDRDLADGDRGHDVRFLRALFNVGSDEPVDKSLRDAVRRFQKRRGAPVVNGVIDVDLWRRVLPERRPSVSVGDAGFNVRVLQAALIAYEGSKHRVTGTYGVLTSRDVRELQEEYHLRPASYVRDPEWAILLGPVNPRIEEARRAARAGEYAPPDDPGDPEDVDSFTAISRSDQDAGEWWSTTFATLADQVSVAPPAPKPARKPSQHRGRSKSAKPSTTTRKTA